ncbi:MAG: acetylglutamate kinase, partial [Armatimonadetes bacterium]|nr:acetylglutamate kinase [Armatimonadota bacterium]
MLEVHAAVDLGRSLAQALRYVNAWKRKSVVVKYGGSVMASGEGEGTLIEDLVLLKGAGIDPVLVHGGGSEITR